MVIVDDGRPLLPNVFVDGSGSLRLIVGIGAVAACALVAGFVVWCRAPRRSVNAATSPSDIPLVEENADVDIDEDHLEHVTIELENVESGTRVAANDGEVRHDESGGESDSGSQLSDASSDTP